MHEEAHNNDRITAEFGGAVAEQAEQHAAKDLADADANARQAHQLLSHLAEFEREADARAVHAAEKGQLETCKRYKSAAHVSHNGNGR